MRPDGTCPGCGRVLELRRRLPPAAPAAASATGPAAASATGPAAAPVPGPATAPGPAPADVTGLAPAPGDRAGPGRESDDDGVGRPKAPWHFKVLLVALVGYLAWRGVQGLDWVADRL